MGLISKTIVFSQKEGYWGNIDFSVLNPFSASDNLPDMNHNRSWLREKKNDARCAIEDREEHLRQSDKR